MTNETPYRADCKCPCHTGGGVMHVMPCCQPGTPAQDLRSALEKCRGQFEFYVQQHLAKAPPDMDKAATNQEFVELCTAALTQPAENAKGGEEACAGCEGIPAPENNPCAVCGKLAHPPAAEPVKRIEDGHSDTEGEACELAAHLNCPACGGSGHVDDVAAGDADALNGYRAALTVLSDAETMQQVASDEAHRIGVRNAEDDVHPACSRRVGLAIQKAIQALATPARTDDAGVGGPILVEWIMELARRDIKREQTDFIGRMHQAMGEFESICDDHPDGDFDEQARDDAGEALAGLAGLALAQLAMVSNSADPLSQLAALSPAPDRGEVELSYQSDDWKLRGYPSAAAEAEDMANVGRALMQAIEKDYADNPFMKGWHPADCPTEIVGDLLNALADATPPALDEGEEK